MIRVNLLPASRASTTQKYSGLPTSRRGAATGMLMLALTSAGIGGWWWGLQRENVGVDAQIAHAESDLSQLKGAAALVDRVLSRKAELSVRLALINRLRSTQREPVQLLSAVSRSLSDGLWLMELKQQGSVVQMEGRANTLTAVTDFIEHLQNSGIFDRPIEITTTSMESLDDHPIVRFAIKAQARAGD